MVCVTSHTRGYMCVVSTTWHNYSLLPLKLSRAQPTYVVPYPTMSLKHWLPLALFAASIYMILGRIIRLLHAEHCSLIKVGRLTKIFVLSDVLSFQVQSAGAAILASKMRGTVHTGQILIIVALLM